MSEVTMEAPPMPTEEALEIFKGMIFGKQSFERFSKNEREAISRAINLLEKQIPKDPVVVRDGSWLKMKCPACGRVIEYGIKLTKNYCRDCGQALKVGD